MEQDGVSFRYYRGLVGRWAGAFRLSVSDAAALRGLPLRIRMMALFARLDGRLRMATTLDALDATTYLHTTRVTKWGIPVLTSRETITLAADGLRFRIEGEQRPLLAPVEPYAGDGEVGPDGALYPIAWAGMPMTQRTRIVPEGLLLTQETVWSKASVLLRRRPGSPVTAR